MFLSVFVCYNSNIFFINLLFLTKYGMLKLRQILLMGFVGR